MVVAMFGNHSGNDRRASRAEDHGDGDRLDHVRALGARGRHLIAEAHERGQQHLDTDRQREQQQSQR